MNVYIVASTEVKAERPTPKNTVLNVKTGRVGSSSVEMTYAARSERQVNTYIHGE